MADLQSPAPPFVVRAVSRTDVGMRRATNQDAVAISPHSAEGRIDGDAFLMVADGMGAHAAGELASKLATDTIPLTYFKSGGEAPPTALRRAIRQANDKIHQKGASAAEFYGMGTTCSCLVLTQGAALVGHVGDSRVYRLRDGVFEQLTFDHSLVWEMAAASKVSADRVPSCIPKNVITRSLGPHKTVIVDLEGPHALQQGDVFLLCSDGLTGVVDDSLAASLLSTLSPTDAAEALVNLANLRGGPDNISVIVAQIETATGDTASGTPAANRPKLQISSFGVGIAAVCAVACAVFFYGGNPVGALASAIGLGVALALSFVKRPASRPAVLSPLLGDALGNGPYRRTECGDHAAAAGDLRDLVSELSNLKSEEETVRPEDIPLQNGNGTPAAVMLDWSPLKERQQAADEAFDRGDYVGSITRYSEIIAQAMAAIRNDDDTHRFSAHTEVIS
ncbi:putative protein phosphatase 2C-type [Botrimarina colliarenosi]|uniref:PPM-type phosphatase domain-containing protein n=1 Tax=Botrimarina colliarenosi TaxID=2528001 RepID=A0A5C6AK94_9BACT|nr:protein phosphatase 2C domain-containing protein [Botrimarina colliarenosi]TWT99585.1 putative protein phosphatase 2C-type [Botrimarina colliarenosi]